MQLRFLLAILTCVTCLTAGVVAREEKPNAKAKEIDKDTVKAWKKRGFEVGWMGSDRDGQMVFRAKPQGLRDAVPAFKAEPATADRSLKGLPPVKVPFGLDLGF